MDSAEEALDYDAMDHSGVNRVFAQDFLQVWDGQNPIVDVGTGTAQIPIEVCRQDPRPLIVGVDLASHMIRVGQDNVRGAGLQDRITLTLVDAKRLDFADGHFAAVISNSIIHHIPHPAEAFAEMVRVCRPGGTLFVRDLLRPNRSAELENLVSQYASDANAHQRQMFTDSLRAALTLGEVRGLLSALGFAPSDVQQTTDRHWTWAARR